MAEAEAGDKTTEKTPTPQRRSYQPNKLYNANRGRGRPNPSVSKALYNFGVTDLRELLDRRHQEQGLSKSGPPPDPSYNYLKDPLRENPNRDHRKPHKDHPDTWSPRSPREPKGRGRDDRYSESDKGSYIQNPVNIKVELSTSTGERSCKFDEETKLPDIKHIPNHRPQERGSFRGNRGRGDGSRGRGDGYRGRGNGSRDRGDSSRGRGDRSRGRGDGSRGRGDSSRDRGDSFRGRGDGSWVRGEGGRGRTEGGRSETGRGRGEYWRGRGDRGRGGRGAPRGRWQSRHHSDPLNDQQTYNQTNIEVPVVPSEDDWDQELVSANASQNISNNQEKDVVLEETSKKDEEEAEYEGELEDYHEEDYEGDEVCSGISEDSKVMENRAEAEIEENLVITSSVLQSEEQSKRTVRFKLDDEKKIEEAENQPEATQISNKHASESTSENENQKEATKGESNKE